MRKEPARRYPSAAQFSADVHAYLDGFPLRAQTDTWGYRTGKFVRRHKAAVAAGAFMLLALIGFGVEMGLMAQRATRQQEVAQKESQFLAGLFQAAGPDVARGRAITARELLDQGAQRVDRELTGEPEVRGALLFSMAGAYRSLGLFDEGAALAQRSYELKAQMRGAEDPGVAASLNLWATLLRDKGLYPQADGLFRRLVSMQHKAYGENSAQLADARSALGECLYMEDKDAEAEPLLRQALAIDRRIGAESGSETRNYLALVLERKGEYPEAAQLLREAEEIGRRRFGADSPDYAISLHNLGSVLIDLGDWNGAESKLREALAIRRKVLGDNHPMLEYSLNNLAFVLREKGDWAAAEPFARENQALVFRTLGDRHPMSAKAENALARVLQSKGDFVEADRLYRQALAILRKVNEPEGWSYAQILANLAMLDLDRGLYAEAESEARESLLRFRKLGAEDTPLVAIGLIEVAEARVFQGDPKTAEPLLREALEIRRRKYKAGHPEIAAAEVRLGEALTAERKAAEAEPLLREALVSARGAEYPLPAWRVADAESALAADLSSLGKEQEAAVLESESAAGLKTNPRPAFRVPARVRIRIGR
jgi:serine/threonine-protein kinase